MVEAISSISAFRAEFQCLLCDETMISPTVCGDCLAAYYYSKDCQAADSTVHQIFCELRTLYPTSFPATDSKLTLCTESDPTDVSWAKLGVCNACGKLMASPKKCGQCLSAFYCSKVCQKADWKAHKVICGGAVPPQQPTINVATTSEVTELAEVVARQASGKGKSTPALQTQVPKPFTQLEVKKWRLFYRNEKDVYKLIVDAFRLRGWEDKLASTYLVSMMHNGVVTEAKSDVFRASLKLAWRKGLLPEWWSPDDTEKLIQFALADEAWMHAPLTRCSS
ncbi:hypothetical protein N7467_003890 [Penicillium canescens]|nr:hypothetical protein N7467_003890 [Penicillium canescens]